ncbi:hypothetical protein BKA62DRAFT_720729 [Auriculariales sp. MPI-PUGE-AT-0066]|nr:hypothetical protein BKA62DRAFT_720729 [Auriculariales sp. MPI-PUGE-AT-0066]
MAAPAKVFWPTTAHPAPSGDVYGWNTRELAVVAAVVDPDTHPRVEVMHRLSSSASTERLVQQAGSLPRVIGARTKTSLFINGRLVRGQNLVLFRPPRPRDLHFLSLESINLHRAPTSPDPLAARLSSIRLADSENELATAIEQINTCDEFAALITGRNVHRAPIGALLLHRIHSLTAPFRLARLRWIRNRCAPLVTRLASVSATVRRCLQ